MDRKWFIFCTICFLTAVIKCSKAEIYVVKYGDLFSIISISLILSILLFFASLKWIGQLIELKSGKDINNV